MLHGKPDAPIKPVESSAENHVHQHCGQSALFRIVPVTLYGIFKSVNAFVFLHEGSSSTLIEQSLVHELGVEGPTVPLCLRWNANMTRSEDESQIVSLAVSEVGYKKKFQLMHVRTVENLNLPSQTLKFTEELPIWSYEAVTSKILVGLQNLQLAEIKKIQLQLAEDQGKEQWCHNDKQLPRVKV